MTFSGNLTDPFYILPLIALHKLFTPSAFLLRSVAVISGILVLPVNYYFCRWIFDRKTAWGTTLLLAVLPVNIVYSRFGREPSQSVLFALPSLYLALALGGGIVRPVLGCAFFGISLICAVLVHPTNFLLAGFGIAGIAARFFHPETGLKKLAIYSGVTGGIFHTRRCRPPYPVFVSSDWFAFWPTIYFLCSYQGWGKWQSVREDLFPHYSDQRGWDLYKAVLDGRVVFAEFEGCWAWRVWDAVIRESGVRYQSFKFQDIAGHPVL